MAIDPNLPTRNIVETAEEGSDGCFAAARLSHQCHQLSWLDMQIDIPQNGTIGLRIGKIDMFEDHLALDRRQGFGIGYVLYCLLGVQKLKNLACGSQRGLHYYVHVGQRANRGPEIIDVSGKCHQRSYRQR